MTEVNPLQSARRSAKMMKQLAEGVELSRNELLTLARDILVSQTMPIQGFHKQTKDKRFLQLCSITAASISALDDDWLDDFYETTNKMMIERYETTATLMQVNKNESANTKTAYMYKKRKGFGK